MKRLACLAVLAACGSAATQPASAPAPVVAASPVEDAPLAPAPFPRTPATPVGRQLSWVLSAIANGGTVSEAEVAAHFHASFLKAVPPSQVVAIVGQLGAAMADVSIVSTKGDPNSLVAHVTGGGQKLIVRMGVEPTSQLIDVLLFAPDSGDAPQPKTYGEAKDMLSKLAPHVSLLVAEADSCKPVTELFPAEPLAIGSTFKLYVLLELANRIIAGKASWEDELAVRDDWKSLPSGTTQNDPAGTKLSLRTFAERMISISDNTATDHLLYMLGRKQVEAAMRSTKHAKPALNAPFLSTREMFLLKLTIPVAERDAYISMPEAKRRAYLDNIATSAPSMVAWKDARRIDKLEWFASSIDLCRAMSTLKTRAGKPKAAPVLEVLSKSPGLPIDKTVFPYVGFKGGSEPGVVNLTLLLRRSDNKWFVATLTANSDEGGALDEGKLVGIARGVIEVLGQGANGPTKGQL